MFIGKSNSSGTATKELLLAISQRVSNMPAYRGMAIEINIYNRDGSQILESNVPMMCFLDKHHRTFEYYQSCVANTLSKLSYDYQVDKSMTQVELNTFVPGVYRFDYNNTFRRRWVKINEIVD